MAGNCPSGGLWWTCTAQNPTFFGCCTTNPCNGHGCPPSDLRPAGLDAGGKSMYPNVSCTSGGLWYTCSEIHPTFQGCCTIDPCVNEKCPNNKLRQASFGSSDNGKDEDGVNGGNGGNGGGDDGGDEGGGATQIYTITTRVGGGGGSDSKPTTVVITSTLSSEPTSDPNANAEYPGDPHHNAGKVAGIAVGVVAGVVLIGALIYGWTWWQKRRKRLAGNPRLSGGPGGGGLGGNVIVNVGMGERGQNSDEERVHRSYLEKLEREG